jgi:segregation and condensation protein B
LIEFNEIKKIVEALIFASDSPITANRINNIITELDSTQINSIINELNAEYDQNEHAFKIVRLSGGFQFVTRSEYAHYIKQYYKGRAKSKLSRAALETLAIIAFKQPISRPEIDSIRGVNCDGVVKNLLERNLIYISGRSEQVGRALLYSTTPDFLQYFGVNKITDLPKPKEIEELLGSAQEELPFSSDELDGKIAEKISTLDESDIIDDEVE